MDHEAVKILALVIANICKNHIHRKHTVFPAIIVSRELADPKHGANHYRAKGKTVNNLSLGA